MSAIALTDRDGVYGVVRAHLSALDCGVRLLIGSEVTIADGSTVVLLAGSRSGYANLCALISKGRLRCPKGESRVSWDEVCEYSGDLVALWGGERSLLVRDDLDVPIAASMRDAYSDRLYAMVTRHRDARDHRRESNVRNHADHYGMATVAATEVLYHSPARRDLQDVLTCIRHGTTMSAVGGRTRSNAEHALKAAHAFRQLYSDDIPSMQRTIEVSERCLFSLSELRYRYPAERRPDGVTESDWLRKLTFEGAEHRYDGAVPQRVRDQLEHELKLIDDLEYGGYFLTMKEIVDYCRENEILCQGRGSAANSAVCYCLGVTAVDPVRMNLLFERFLSRERAEPPDIDLDISHQRREEVIQHVYEKYGRTYAAMVANFIRYRPKSAIRDVGRALGIPETALNRLSKVLDRSGGLLDEQLRQAGLDPRASSSQHLLRLATEIQDFPRHLSIHPGGFLLGHEAVHSFVPIENATMPDRTVVQWDKYDIEDLGLFKVDLLGLGALTQIDQCFRLIETHRGHVWDMATVPPDDTPTYDMICEADTIGVFQIESRAQMAMLPRLRPRRFYDIVIEVSIVRPGPITGGMVHPYLRRRTGKEEVVYPHPCLEPVLAKTLGVPLFQEQVMKLAVVAADYSPGEADQLRRDMAAWKRSGRIEKHRQRLVSRMMAKGIAREFAERVFEQIRGFGEYGFPESHAASFALIAYVTSWLKCHYHAEFTCSLLNAQPMGFYAPSTIVEDAKRHGVTVFPIDVTRSAWDCSIEVDESGAHGVRMGLRYVKGLGTLHRERYEAALARCAFQSVEDFVRRTAFDEGALTRLAESGAFGGFHIERREALWRAQGAARTAPTALPLIDTSSQPVFEGLDRFEEISWDYQFSSHSARGHILEELRDQLHAMRLPDAATLREKADGSRVRYAGIIICRQRPGTASGVVFFTLEDESGFVNVITWPKVYERNALLLKTTSFIGVRGKLQVQEGVVHVLAESFWLPKVTREPTRAKSRDFH